jgi:predicted ABC-type ATPase
MGFAVVLLVVCLDDPQRLIARVQQRVLEGGHAVPEERILGRYPRTLENLTKAVRLADMAILYDTGEIDAQHLALPTRVAVCRAAVTKRLHEVMPVWAETVLGAEL